MNPTAPRKCYASIQHRVGQTVLGWIFALALALGVAIGGGADEAAASFGTATTCNYLSAQVDRYVDASFAAYAAGDTTAGAFYDRKATEYGRQYHALGC